MGSLSVLTLFFVAVSVIQASNIWANHDISTLRLVQVVFRHGDRTALDLPPNDPYRDEKYWPEGIGQLTKNGKLRMYKLGQFIRQQYDQYLGQKYSAREVYARSSASDRCIESASLLLAGAYPPKSKAVQWSNGSDAELGLVWQPIPIQTFIPKSDDTVLNEVRHDNTFRIQFITNIYFQDKPCKAEDEEMARIFNRTEVQNFVAENKEFFANLSKIVGTDVQFTTWAADYLYDALSIEVERGLYWDKMWTQSEEEAIIAKLHKAIELEFRISWDTPVQQRLLGGGLLKELKTNFDKVVNKENDKKLYVYSTHDSLTAVLMESYGIYNDIRPPYGSTLYLELHQRNANSSTHNNSDYFVRVYYQNSTDLDGGVPHSIKWGLHDCLSQTDCPYDRYLNSTKQFIYNNFDEECNRNQAF